jgi:cytochrome oxidase assembly protein ShyY1
VNEWRFLASPRWAGYLALVVVFAIACSALGTWQFNRRAEALAEVARIDANYDADPMPVAEALPDPESFDIDQRWQVVTLSGEYLHDEEVVVRNRPGAGSSGFEVLTPMRIPQDSEGRPSEAPLAPEGQVEVTARLKAGEQTIAGRTSSGAEFATIDLDELAERVGEPAYTGAYGILVQSGADASEPPLALPRPVRDEGPHLSYALQWFVFALMGFVALGWFANQERKLLATEGAERSGTLRRPAAEPKRPPKPPRGRSDADVEDEILDRH